MLTHARTISKFFRLNHDQVGYITRSLCSKHRIESYEDMVQEVYSYIMDKKILKKYDPNNPNKASFSTFMYTVIENVIRTKKHGNENQIEKSRFRPAYRNTSDYSDPAIRLKDIAVDYENILEQNKMSDDMEGLGSTIDDFEQRFLPTVNKVYTLQRRRDKKTQTTGTSLLIVFRLLREGYSSREISRIYGVSDMFISNLKKKISNALKEYGLEPLRSKKKAKKSLTIA